MAEPLTFELRCDCGTVTGRILPTPPSRFNHCVCYCKDCQAYAHALGRARDILDPHGGTRILQVAPKRIEITRGHEHVRCLRLSPRGLFRFYAGCCSTPIANAASPALPIVGLVHNIVKDLPADAPALPVKARVYGRDGHGSLPPGTPEKITTGNVVGVIGLLIGGRLRGEHKGSPFFDDETGAPMPTPEVVSTESRKAAYAAAAVAPV